MPSHFHTMSPWEMLWNPATLTERFVLDAADLPRLREHLELRLKVLEVTDQASVSARRQVEARLKDVEIAEQTLRDMDNG